MLLHTSRSVKCAIGSTAAGPLLPSSSTPLKQAPQSRSVTHCCSGVSWKLEERLILEASCFCSGAKARGETAGSFQGKPPEHRPRLILGARTSWIRDKGLVGTAQQQNGRVWTAAESQVGALWQHPAHRSVPHFPRPQVGMLLLHC